MSAAVHQLSCGWSFGIDGLMDRVLQTPQGKDLAEGFPTELCEGSFPSLLNRLKWCMEMAVHNRQTNCDHEH